MGGYFSSGLIDSGASGLGEQAPIVNGIQTTDGSETTIIEIGVAEGQTVRVEVWITARRSDGVESGSWHLAGLFSRNGDVALVGTIQDVASFLSATASWTVDMAADTATQSIDINVTGEAGEAVDWTAKTNHTIEEG